MTVFDHFCAGTTAEESLAVVENYSPKKGFHTGLFRGRPKKKSIWILAFKKLGNLRPFCPAQGLVLWGVQATGVGRFDLYEKSTVAILSAEETAEERVEKRFEALCIRAQELGIGLLIDVRCWIQPAVDRLIERLMERFNTERPIVYNTLQMYCHDRLAYLQELTKKAKDKGFVIGVKLVRGAYLEKETTALLLWRIRLPCVPLKLPQMNSLMPPWNLSLKT